MPRKAFIADLNDAVANFERSNVSGFRSGEEDGMINFIYQQSRAGGTEVTVLVPGRCLPICRTCSSNFAGTDPLTDSNLYYRSWSLP